VPILIALCAFVFPGFDRLMFQCLAVAPQINASSVIMHGNNFEHNSCEEK
jgi:hypothetical protein